MPSPGTALVIICVRISLSLIATAQAACTKHKIIQSKVNECQDTQEGKHCTISTNAQVTANLEYTACLWLSDQEDNHLINMEIKVL